MRSPFPLSWLFAALATTMFTDRGRSRIRHRNPHLRYGVADPLFGRRRPDPEEIRGHRGAASTDGGEKAELDWIREHHPGATFQSRGRITGPPHYDVVTVKLASGALLDLHFDISGFFGK